MRDLQAASRKRPQGLWLCTHQLLPQMIEEVLGGNHQVTNRGNRMNNQRQLPVRRFCVTCPTNGHPRIRKCHCHANFLGIIAKSFAVSTGACTKLEE